MAHIVIHYGEHFNVYSTVVDAPIFDEGLTLKELKQYYKEEYGNEGLRALDNAMPRIMKCGTSSRISDSLEATVKWHLDREKISLAEFVLKYL